MITLQYYADINPHNDEIDRTNDQHVAFVPMAAISENGYLEAHETRPLTEIAKGYTFFKRHDVLLAKITPCMENGKAALISNLSTEFGFGSTEFHVLRPRPNVDARFLFYLVWNQHFRNEAAKHMTGSAGQKRVPTTYLKQAKVPLFTPTEQRRIADILDKADAIRRKRKEAIALTEELLRSTFLEMFGDPATNPKGWPVKPLGELADITSGVTKGKRYNDQTMVTLPYMRVANVQDGHLMLDEIKTISVSEEEGQRYQLKNGDVLLTEGGDPDKLGRGTVWRGEIEGCIHQNHIFRVRPKSEIRADYLSSIIGNDYGKKYFLRSAKQTTGIATINMTQLKAFPVLLPPINLQEAYCTVIGHVAAVRSTLRRKSKFVEDLFNSMVHHIFSK